MGESLVGGLPQIKLFMEYGPEQGRKVTAGGFGKVRAII